MIKCIYVLEFLNGVRDQIIDGEISMLTLASHDGL